MKSSPKYVLYRKKGWFNTPSVLEMSNDIDSLKQYATAVDEMNRNNPQNYHDYVYYIRRNIPTWLRDTFIGLLWILALTGAIGIGMWMWYGIFHGSDAYAFHALIGLISTCTASVGLVILDHLKMI